MTPNIKRAWFGYFCVLLTWGILAYGLIGQYFTEGNLFAQVRAGRPYISDFVSVYNAAFLAKQCLTSPVHIYDFAVQNNSMEQLIAPVKAELPFYFQYPPQFFLIVLTLAYFSLPVAYGIWTIAGLIFSLSALWMINAGKLKTLFAKSFFVVAFLSSFPAWLSFRLGQPSLLILFAMAAFWCFLERRKYYQAGFASVIAAIKLQYFPVIAVVGCLNGKWRYLSGLIFGSLLLFALSAKALTIENVLYYPRALFQGETTHALSGVAPEEMQNLRGALTLLKVIDHHWIALASMVAMAGALVFIAWLWWKEYPRLSKSEEDAFFIIASLTVLIALAFSPHTHRHDYVQAVMPCFWLWQWTNKTERSKSVTLLRAMIISFPVLSWIFFVLRGVFALLFIQPYFLWALMVIALTLKILNKERLELNSK
jgi:hypothetical protein